MSEETKIETSNDSQDKFVIDSSCYHNIYQYCVSHDNEINMVSS